MTLRECKRDIMCVDCDNRKCWNYGSLIADCPLDHCDRQADFHEDCESCELLKKIKEQRDGR